MIRTTLLLTALVAFVLPGTALAQPPGTFRWQLQPYCNVISVAVTQNGSQYRLEGTDDQCGGTNAPASVIGTAFLNPDGTVGMGLNIVSAPDGVPTPIATALSLATLSGTWRDSAGRTGTFAFTPGAGTGGTPRPLPTPAVPSAVVLSPTGSVVASGTFGVGSAPASGAGVRMMWYPGKAAFRAGEVADDAWDEPNIGRGSAAFGISTRASGYNSTAMGYSTTASGFGSTATGVLTSASGDHSTAMGWESQARGFNSVAIGWRSIAVGDYSVALGAGAVAQQIGSFVFADASSRQPLFALGANEFTVRASGGVAFFSNAAASLGVRLAPGATQWSSLSDVRSKHLFRDLDGEDILTRVARLAVTEWSYKAQDPSIRHIGPTAQDFRAAFGLGEDPLRIGTLDAEGVALAGVKALETRTRLLRVENQVLRDALDRVTQALEDQHVLMQRELKALHDRIADMASQHSKPQPRERQGGR